MNNFITNLLFDQNKNINPFNNTSKSKEEAQQSKSFYFLAYLTAVLHSLVKIFLLVYFWPFIASPESIREYLDTVYGDDTFYSKSFLHEVVLITNYSGVLLLVFDVFFSFFSRKYFLNYENLGEIEKRYDYMSWNIYIAPLTQGLISEFILTVNQIQLENDPNFFNCIYWFRNKFMIYLLITYTIIIIIMCFKSFQGEQVGTVHTIINGSTASVTPLFAGGGMIGGLAGSPGVAQLIWKFIKCYVLMGLCIFPILMGLTSYVYLLFYLKDFNLKIFYNLEFLLNFILIFLHANSGYI